MATCFLKDLVLLAPIYRSQIDTRGAQAYMCSIYMPYSNLVNLDLLYRSYPGC